MSTEDKEIELKLVDNRDESRFEFELEQGKLGTVEYQLLGRKIQIDKVEVPEDLRGKGYGTAITEATLSHIDDIRFKTIVACPFAKDYIDNHPEWQQLLYKTDTT